MSAKKRLEIRLEKDDYELLKGIADKTKKPMSSVVREAVYDLYNKVSREEKLEAVRRIASLEIDLPPIEEFEKEIESMFDEESLYEDE
ncbi:MAG: ribbon-helix-helix protein, CopG family [Actinobacteria bacterium]|nr:ribbon-helix-helix protein, CopG family [Actinomycetota bacterium]